jgi:hypothetical protein
MAKRTAQIPVSPSYLAEAEKQRQLLHETLTGTGQDTYWAGAVAELGYALVMGDVETKTRIHAAMACVDTGVLDSEGFKVEVLSMATDFRNREGLRLPVEVERAALADPSLTDSQRLYFLRRCYGQEDGGPEAS